MKSPFHQASLDALRLALELFKKGGRAEYRFCIVIADHAVTLLFLDKLTNLGEIVMKKNKALNFQDAIEKLEELKITIPEKSGITTVNAERNSIIHKGTRIIKPDARYHLEKIYIFFNEFLRDQYKKKIPSLIQEYNPSLIDTKQRKEKMKHNSVTQFIESKKEKASSPIISFVNSYNLLFAVLNLLGYQRKILIGDTTFNLKNLKKLVIANIITKFELNKLENVVSIKANLESGKEIDLNRYDRLTKFMDSLLHKITKFTPKTMAEVFDNIGKEQMIDLILSLPSTKVRNEK